MTPFNEHAPEAREYAISILTGAAMVLGNTRDGAACLAAAELLKTKPARAPRDAVMRTSSGGVTYCPPRGEEGK